MVENSEPALKEVLTSFNRLLLILDNEMKNAFHFLILEMIVKLRSPLIVLLTPMWFQIIQEEVLYLVS